MTAGKDSNTVAAVRAEFIELWGRLALFWGVTPGAARIFGWLLSRAEPADADQIASELSISRGGVSIGVRELEEWGLVVRKKTPGERRELFAPEVELERAVKSIVRTRKRREWDPMLERLREWVPKLEGERGADAETFRQRLEQIEAMVVLADGFARSFLEGGVVQKLALKTLVAAADRAGRRAARKRR